MGRLHAERAILPLLPWHGECLDSVGGWADLVRGDLPAPPCVGDGDQDCCPAAAGFCEPALLLADDAELSLPSRIAARRHALDAGCPPQALAQDDLTLPPDVRRRRAALAQGEGSEPWASEVLAVHGLWADALAERAVLGDPDALDLLADVVHVDRGAWPAAERALGECHPPSCLALYVGRDGPAAAADSPGELARRLKAASGPLERGPNIPPDLELGLGVPAPADALDALTGSGDATHAVLAEAEAVKRFIGRDLDRLEAALLSPVSAGSPPGDVHGAFVAGGGAPGATALAVALVWGDVGVAWVADGGAVRVKAGEREWWLDGCAPARRVGAGDPEGEPVPPLALAAAERVGAWLRLGEIEHAREADDLLAFAPGARRWAPRVFPRPDPGSASTRPPWEGPSVGAKRRGRLLTPFALPTPTEDRRARAEAVRFTQSPEALAVTAWAAWRAQDPELARMLLGEAPQEPWPRYAWRVVAAALGEPGEEAVRPTGCAPALWAGPG